MEPSYPQSLHTYFMGRMPMVDLGYILWPLHFGQNFGVGGWCLSCLRVSQSPLRASTSLDLDVLEGEAQAHEDLLHHFPVVSLEEDLVVLGRAAAGALLLQGGG